MKVCFNVPLKHVYDKKNSSPLFCCKRGGNVPLLSVANLQKLVNTKFQKRRKYDGNSNFYTNNGHKKGGKIMNDYNQIRSFNVGIAQETSIEAAMIYDDLAYAQKIFGKEYFFHSYQQMLQRFPFLSERTIRRHVKLLVNKGWISTKIKKVNGSPTCHYRIEKTLTAKLAETMETETDKLAETMETDKLAETYNIATKETTKTLLSKDNSKEKIKDFSFGATKEKKEKKSKDSFENREILEISGDLQSAKADCPPQFRSTPPQPADSKSEADDPKDEIKKQFYRVIKQYQLPVVNHKHINGWCDKLRTGLGANTAVHYLVRLQ